MANDPNIPLILGVAGGAYMFWQGFIKLAEYRVIARTPTSKIRSLSLGLVEIAGQAKELDQLLLSPFSSTSCVYYSYSVEEKVQSGKRTYWKTIAADHSHDPFIIIDNTGQILVIPFGADLRFNQDHFYKSSIFGTEPEFERGLSKLGIDPGGFLFKKNLRCKETVVEPGDEIYVLGTAQIKEGYTRSERNEENLYIGAQRKNYFIISDHSEKQLITTSSWAGYLMIILGPILTVTCLFFLLQYWRLL